MGHGSRKPKYKDIDRGTVDQTEDHPGAVVPAFHAFEEVPEDAGSIPAGSSLTVKQLRKLAPQTEIAREAALLRATTFTEYPTTHRRILPPSNVRPSKVARAQLNKVVKLTRRALPRRSDEEIAAELKDNEERAELFRFIQERYDKSKVDLFHLIANLDGTVEYALPECCHELDPEMLFSMLEDFDFQRFALAMGYSHREIQTFSRPRKAQAASS